MRKVIVIAALCLLSFSQVGQAELTISQYQKLKDEKSFEVYLHGYVTGLQWANTHLQANGLTPLFCVPPKLILTADNSIQLLDDYLAEHEVKGAPFDYMELYMMLALRNAFPCE